MAPSTRPGRGRRYRYSAMALVALMALSSADRTESKPPSAAPAADNHADHPLFAAAAPQPAAPAAMPGADAGTTDPASVDPAPVGPISLGTASLGIPATVLAAYHRAADAVSKTNPGCGLDWTVLAAIGKVESNHAGNGDVTASGKARQPILGPALDGTNGMAMILAAAGRPSGLGGPYARAEGPMQFLPSTWAKWAADGTGDGTRDIQNVFDATLAAAHYLCAGNANLSTANGLRDAILRYNPSLSYLDLVTYWIRSYDKGVGVVPDRPAGLPDEVAVADAPRSHRQAPPQAPPRTSSAAQEGKPATESRPAGPGPAPQPGPAAAAPPADSTKPLLQPVTDLVNGVTGPLVGSPTH